MARPVTEKGKSGSEGAVAPCPIEATLGMIGSKWKVLVLRELFRGGVKRFNELSRGIGGITQKMLSQQLKQMERDGLVIRRAYPEVPPRVEYSLSPVGRSLRPVMSSIYEWGNEYLSGEAGPED
jgi:DNA-binding HxlR family transcriptional regulator